MKKATLSYRKMLKISFTRQCRAFGHCFRAVPLCWLCLVLYLGQLCLLIFLLSHLLPISCYTHVKISQAITGLVAQQPTVITVYCSIMFQHFVYSLANRQGLFAYARTCKTRLNTTTKFMVVVIFLFNLVIPSFPDNIMHEHGC